MTCPHVEKFTFLPPTPTQSVYREDCTQCFDSIDDPDGLDVCLQCFNGGCSGDGHRHAQLHNVLWGHPLVLNVRRTRKVVVRDEPPSKMSKLSIAAETEADRYDTMTTARCLECNLDLDKDGEKLGKVVKGIMEANSFSRKEEVKAWEQEMTSCEHILTLQQDAPREIEPPNLGHCSKCKLKENLWLCLQCGNLGCGRAQFGGVGGNSHALAHKNESKHGVAVKMGSITPEGTADVYCYICDEERVDEDLATHLANWGIILSERQKTEKSLTEMQIEQNLRWEFSMTSEDGNELEPLFGPGLTGLKNLGNSCYLASILQCLFDIAAFQNRYYVADQDVIDLPVVPDPAQDLETQFRKIAHGLLSGRYSKSDPDVKSRVTTADKVHQKGIAPAMFKHLIGHGHAEFSTMRQQDAFEMLQHLVKLITRSKHPTPAHDPTQSMRFTMEQRLQCRSCFRVRYASIEQDSISINVPLQKLSSKDGEEPKYKPVNLIDCLDRFTAQDYVELTCPKCGSKDGFIKQQLFKTFPDVLVVNMNKMTVEDWVPVKVDIPILIDDGPLWLDKYLSAGQKADEEALPDDGLASGAAAFVAVPELLAQLEGMGFPRVRCEKALYATGNQDANAAMEWLFGHMDDPNIDIPGDWGGASTAGDSGAVDPEKIEMLGAMGFEPRQAKKALRETGGDVERAIDWLFNHPDDQGGMHEEAAPAGSSAGQGTSVAGNADPPAQFNLRSIVCHKGTSIHAGHYVAFIHKELPTAEDSGAKSWVLFNDEKVVKTSEIDEMKKTAYVYFFTRL